MEGRPGDLLGSLLLVAAPECARIIATASRLERAKDHYPSRVLLRRRQMLYSRRAGLRQQLELCKNNLEAHLQTPAASYHS